MGKALAIVAILFLIVVAFGLAGCQSIGGGFCAAAKKITPEQSDVSGVSDSLAAQIVAHNETGAALGCWKP